MTESKLWTPLAERVADRGWERSSIFATGFPGLDVALGGGLEGGLLTLLHAMNHHGKTQFLMNLIASAPQDKAIVLFTPDETESLVARKLVAIGTGISKVEIADQLSTQEAFSHLATRWSHVDVCDRTLRQGEILEYLATVADGLDREIGLVAYDYLSLYPGALEDSGRIRDLKHLCSESAVPWILLHQDNKRSTGGQMAMAQLSGAEAAVIFGVVKLEAALSHFVAGRQQVDDVFVVALEKNKLGDGQWTGYFTIGKGGKFHEVGEAKIPQLQTRYNNYKKG